MSELYRRVQCTTCKGKGETPNWGYGVQPCNSCYRGYTYIPIPPGEYVPASQVAQLRDMVRRGREWTKKESIDYWEMTGALAATEPAPLADGPITPTESEVRQ